MAWTTVYPSATQYPEGWGAGGTIYHFVWWNMFRTMRGNVQMRLTDVTSGDFNWGTCRMHVQLRNNAGQILSSKYIYKTWGVQPAFVNIGYVSGQQSVQLGTAVGMGYDYFQAPYNGVTWRSELRWDNALPV